MENNSPKSNERENKPVCDFQEAQTFLEESASQDQAKSGIVSRWKTDPLYRKKMMFSSSIILVFIGLGMFVGQAGTTLLDLRIISDTSLEESSMFFTGSFAGYMIGSIVTGIIYTKVNKHVLIFASTLCMGCANIMIPYCSQYHVMVFMHSVVGLFGGSVDTGSNAEMMRLWGSEADRPMQVLHFCYNFGGFISPILAEPYLAEKESATQSIANTSDSNFTSSPNRTAFSQHTDVHYSYLIVGIFIVSTSIPILVLYLILGSFKEETHRKNVSSDRNIPFPLYILLLGVICTFFIVYKCIKDGFLLYLMTFLVQEFDSISKSEGAYANSVAWFSSAAGRFAMIFIAKCVRPLSLVASNVAGMLITIILFTLLAYYRVTTGLLVMSALFPASMVAVFPSGMCWIETEMFRVTGVVSSCVVVACSIGNMVNPRIIGFVMEKYGNMSYCYTVLVETSLLCFILILMVIVLKCYVKKKYGDRRTSKNCEIDIVEVDNSKNDIFDKNGFEENEKL